MTMMTGPTMTEDRLFPMPRTTDAADIEWMLEQVRKRNLSHTTPEHCRAFLERFGKREVALRAIAHVWDGKPEAFKP